jgi:hypothetical protein
MLPASCLYLQGMQQNEEHKNRKFQAALLIAMLLLFTVVFCRRWIWNLPVEAHKSAANYADYKRSKDPWNKVHADSSLKLAKNGDLVLRAGSDEVSALFKRSNSHDKSYSHAGIVFIENGCPMVYNCIGNAENPHQVLQRDSLLAYIDPKNNTGFAIYRFSLSSKQMEKLHDIAVQYFKEARRFDPNFNLGTDSLLYCTEFVYKALIETTGKKDYFPISEVNNFDYVAPDNLYSRKDMKLICKIGYKQ